MEVSAKHEGQTLTFFLVGELDHHGAKGLLENLEREIERIGLKQYRECRHNMETNLPSQYTGIYQPYNLL